MNIIGKFLFYIYTKKSQQFTEIKAQNNKVNTAANNQHFLKKFRCDC